MSCPRPRPLFPEALALLKAGQKPRRSVGAELPRGAQMGKLGPSSAIQQPFCLAAKQPASASLPLTFRALPPSPRPPPSGWRKRRVPEPPDLPPLCGVGRRMKDGLQLVWCGVTVTICLVGRHQGGSCPFTLHAPLGPGLLSLGRVAAGGRAAGARRTVLLCLD